MTTKEELLKSVALKSDEIKLENFEKIVKNPEFDAETRKNAFLAMTDIYIKKMWWGSVAKAYNNAADLAKTFGEKQELFFKAGTFYVRSDDYFTAEDTFRKSIVLAPKKDRTSVLNRVYEVYISLAREYENRRMQTKAISVYNKVLTLNLPLDKANEIRERMAVLYERIGKPREATWIKQQKANATEQEKKKLMPEEKEEDNEFRAQDLLN
jgi:tetratricopeptide (TPR) repeat protein